MAEDKKIATGYIGNALRSSAADHTTTFADEIFDTERQKYQNEVTADLEKTDNEIKADLEAETARAKAAEQANAQTITDEKNRAMAAEKAIIFDVSAYNNSAVFESLQALLSSSNLSALIPQSVRHGGMTIRFIQGSDQSSDNKYVQYRLMTTSFSTTEADWQGVDNEPTPDSENLVKSGGVYDATYGKIRDISKEFAIVDKENNAIVIFNNGHVKTKYFDSANIVLDNLADTLINILPKISENNAVNIDLDVRDVFGNIIAVLYNGNIKTKNFDSSSIALENLADTLVNVLPKISDNYTANIDLDLRDVLGNVIAAFSNGHLRTKNFDSAYLSHQLTTFKFKGKSLGIIGDSISTYSGWLPSNISGYDGASYASYYPKQDVDNVNKTWWYKVAENLRIDVNKIINCSWSGSRITGNSEATNTAEAGCSDRRVSDLTAKGFIPDIIICFISCNDWAGDIPIGTWKVSDSIPAEGVITTLRDAYSLLLSKLETEYPLSRIFVCGNLPDIGRDHDFGWPSNNGNNVSVYEWNQSIKEVANAFGCHFIDLYQCGANYFNYEDNFSIIRGVSERDRGLHPNTEGHKLLSDLITKELINNY